MPGLELRWLAGSYAICRLPAGADVPKLVAGRFLSVTRTEEELSLVCGWELAPPEARREGPYRLFRVAGSMDLGLTGVLAALAAPLAAGGIPVFAVATFDTDYILIRTEDAERAERALLAAGHRFPGEAGR